MKLMFLEKTVLLIFSPKVKAFIILTHINNSPELLIKLVARKLRM